MSKSTSGIPEPFDPEEFRSKGHQIIDILSEYLKDALSGKEMAVLPWQDPDKLTELFSFAFRRRRKRVSGFLCKKNNFIVKSYSSSTLYRPSGNLSPASYGTWFSFVLHFLIMELQFMKWGRFLWQWKRMLLTSSDH